MSADEHIKGINQLPNLPIKYGIIKKKTMITLCPVTIRLYEWLERKLLLGVINSYRINLDKEDLTSPKNSLVNIYKVPMSL